MDKEFISNYIANYGDWRGNLLQELQTLISSVLPEAKVELKWGVPVWTQKGLVCAISGFKDHVKMNFFNGAHLKDPQKLFNSGLDSKEHRSINFAQGDQPNKAALKELLLKAAAYNTVG